MSSLQETLKKVKSEELLSRFRSKEDLYKYMTIQSKTTISYYQYIIIVGLFLPSIKGTRLSFIRAILSNQKKAIKQQDLVVTSVPYFEELSVKNLYKDAMKDQILQDYLPDLQMNSNRLPERKFFFGILSTIKHDYLQQIIFDANINRYQINDANKQEDYISIDDAWYQELIKYPYISKKPGKAIFLIKQRSKLFRQKKIQHKFDLSSRLNEENNEETQMEQLINKGNKRQKLDFDLNDNLSLNEFQQHNMQFNI